MINIRDTLMDFGITAFMIGDSPYTYRVDIGEKDIGWINVSLENVGKIDAFDFLKNIIAEENI